MMQLQQAGNICSQDSLLWSLAIWLCSFLTSSCNALVWSCTLLVSSCKALLLSPRCSSVSLLSSSQESSIWKGRAILRNTCLWDFLSACLLTSLFFYERIITIRNVYKSAGNWLWMKRYIPHQHRKFLESTEGLRISLKNILNLCGLFKGASSISFLGLVCIIFCCSILLINQISLRLHQTFGLITLSL